MATGLYLGSIEAGRDGEVAQLVKNLMALAVDRIVTTEELLRVRVVELHGDAAGCVAVSCRVYQVDAVVAGGVAPATRVSAHRTVLQIVQTKVWRSFIFFCFSQTKGLHDDVSLNAFLDHHASLYKGRTHRPYPCTRDLSSLVRYVPCTTRPLGEAFPMDEVSLTDVSRTQPSTKGQQQLLGLRA